MQKSKFQFKIKKSNKLQEVYVYNSSDDAVLSYSLNRQGENLELYVFFHLKGSDILNLKTITSHMEKNTSAFTYVCGVVFDNAKVKHEGMIKILPEGQMTNAYLKSKILLISDGAKAESIPSLEIEANDVKASHGVSIGRLDKEQLFYLQSRGLDRITAEYLMINGFYEPFIENIASLPVQDKVRELLCR